MSSTNWLEMSGKGLSRQSSRNGFSCKQLLFSPPCRQFLCTGFLLFVGIMFGVYLDAYFLTEGLLGRPPHSDEKCRPGLSIKKNFSIQFRDYIPRFIFIDVSYGPPNSLDLFFETYPDAQKYTIYVFLADQAYAPLYAKFPKTNLLLATVPSTTNKTFTPLQEFVSDEIESESKTAKVTTVDFSSWLKNTVHPDEHVILKMSTTPRNEEDIVQQLVETAAIEWIDKYYTTSTDEETIGQATGTFSIINLDVLLWKDGLYTYSDFENVNPPTVKRDKGQKVSECNGKKTANKFALLLYMSQVNQFSLAALKLLSQISMQQSIRLPVTILFPLQFLHSHTLCSKLAIQDKAMSLGLYLNPTSFSLLRKDQDHLEKDKAEMNHVRNKLVSTEHCFSKGNSTVDYILFSSEVAFAKANPERAQEVRKDQQIGELHTKYKLLKVEVSKRKYTVLSNVIDITPMLGETSVNFPTPNFNGNLLGFDISAEGTDTALLHLLRTHSSDMIPISDCVTKPKEEK